MEFAIKRPCSPRDCVYQWFEHPATGMQRVMAFNSSAQVPGLIAALSSLSATLLSSQLNYFLQVGIFYPVMFILIIVSSF